IRAEFGQPDLESMAASIQELGLLHRPIVRRFGDRYQIVVGERRMRAMRDVLGWKEIPVDLRDVPDSKMFALAWLENRERVVVSPWEEARAAARLRARLMAEGKPVTTEIIARELRYKSPTSAWQLLRIVDRIDEA